LAQSLESSGRRECTRIGDAHDGNQNHSVEDRGKRLDASELDGDNEGRATTGGLIQEWGVGGHNEPDEEEVDDVEDANTPNDLLGSFRNFLSWVLGFGGSKSGEFGSTKSK
jgi:hypothetical protein